MLLVSAVSSSEALEKNRDRIHTLLVGIPGTGKSQLIRECVKLVPNSRYESSQHASGKSLTAIVAKEEEDYCLRIGPVPLARGAICVLNEIGRTTQEDQGLLLDAMEEGEFTINKYGINTKIRAPTVIVASANPINSTN
jgi:DNA replicative helicase MCM subunit Mcm2 (Cdc46/Mcm family)